MTIEYGLQSRITSVDTILLVHPSKHYIHDEVMEMTGSPYFKGEEYHEGEDERELIATLTEFFENTKKNFEGLEQRFDTSRIYSIVNQHPAIIQFGNFIDESKNRGEILSKKDARELLKQGTNIMLGGGYIAECHALVFNELVLCFLYPDYGKEVSGDKLRIIAPANYIFNADGDTLDNLLKTEDGEEFLELFQKEYLRGHTYHRDFHERISPFSYTLSFDGEVIVEHRAGSKKEFSLEVLSSI